jgi:hypothetical protein
VSKQDHSEGQSGIPPRLQLSQLAPYRRHRTLTLHTIKVNGLPDWPIYLGPLDGLQEDACEERAVELKARHVDGRWVNPETNSLVYERLDILLLDGTIINDELSYQTCRVACKVEAMQADAPTECFYPAEDIMRYAVCAPALYEALKRETGQYLSDPNKGWEGKALPVSAVPSPGSASTPEVPPQES